MRFTGLVNTRAAVARQVGLLFRTAAGGRGRTARVGTAVVTAAMAASLLGAGLAAAAGDPTLYVSASAGSDGNPCTQAAPCLTIGHAIAVAAAGSTIEVSAGTYHEQVFVTKRLVLEGQSAIIDASSLTAGLPPLSTAGLIGYGILVAGPGASGSTVRGFTVENATGEGILAAMTSNVALLDNVVRHSDKGFGTSVTTECQAQGAIPGDCGEGLHLLSVTRSRVVGNQVTNNVGGILVTDEMGPSSGNLIAFNVSMDNKLDCGITLPSHNANAVADPSKGGVYGNRIIGNLSEGNGGAGVGMFAPFPGTASYDNQVIGNTLLNNGEAGVAIHAHAPGQNVSGNVIIGNRISGNGIDPDSGSGQTVGIALFSAVVPVNVVVAANRISNEYYGIYRAGTINATGLASNHFASTVTVPIH
jgi:nitrous oxidase accessory protein NosD